MNAQDQWAREYATFKGLFSRGARENQREIMRKYRREAALERKCEALQRTIDVLAALVRLKYGNLDPDVNKILADIGHGWPTL